MDTGKLASFISVYDNRSFTRAAEELRLSQPTISEHIKSLEYDLGCRLFERLGKKVSPTKEADSIYHKAVRIIEESGGLKETVSRVSGRIEGSLVVGASTIPGTYILPGLVGGFKAMHPGVSFEIEIGDTKKITERVMGHDLALGVVGAKMAEDKLRYEPIVSDSLVLAAPPRLIERQKIDLKDIQSLPFILRERGSGTRKIMEQYLSGRGVAIGSLNVVAVLGSTDAVKQAVKSGVGVSIISEMSIRDEAECGAIKIIPTGKDKISRRFYAISHKKRMLPAKYGSFMDYLLSACRKVD